MYFHSRAEAGQKLAEQLKEYQGKSVVVVALGDGAVTVGEPIAKLLHCRLGLLLTEDIDMPGEGQSIGTVAQDGSFVYNSKLSEGEIEDYYSEFHGYLEDQKREKFAKINRLMGEGGALEVSMLREHVVILVADGFKTGAALDAAVEFLKPIKIQRLVVTTPIASVVAVDRMHIIGDELHCLSVTENYISTDHYYDINDVLSHEEIISRFGKGLYS